MTSADQLRAALDAVSAVPDGDAKIAELQRIVAHADALGEVRIGFDGRFGLIGSYNNHTERWKMLAPFGWCLATFDREPQLFDDFDAEMLRWYHKWAIATLHSTPQVGLAQTYAALDDLERRFREGGHSLQAIYNLRCRTASHIGDLEAARRYLDLWMTAPRDENSDCEGCDPSRQATLCGEWGEWERATALLAPVLSGAAGCDEQPERGMAKAMAPLAYLGRFADAAKAHVRAYRRHRHERDAFPYLADHLRFCTLTSNFAHGLAILAEHLSWLDRPYDEASAMDFSATGARVCQLATEHGLGEQSIHRSEHGERAAAEITVRELAAHLAAQARHLADLFDARNGTTHQSQRIEQTLTESPLTSNLELPPDRPSYIATADAGEVTSAVIAPLTLQSVAAVLTERADDFIVEDGSITGRWGEAIIRFECPGRRGEILYIRAIATRGLPSQRRQEAYSFCNSWNHDRLIPKAYVHESDDDELVLAGEVVTDLEHGIAQTQLAALVNSAIQSCALFAQGVNDLSAT